MPRLASGQYLLVSQIYDTLTHVADHGAQGSHDAITRSVRGEQSTPRLLWENVRGPVVQPPGGSVVFDDTGRDNNSSCAIAWVRHYYRGHATQVLQGLGGVPCVDVHPALDLCWLIAYRLDAPDGDGTRTLAHVRERLTHGVYHKQRPCQAVGRDTGDAPKDLLWCSASVQKVSDGPRKDNRHVADSRAQPPYQRVDTFSWTAADLAHGTRIKLQGLPQAHQGHLVRVVVSTHRTDSVVTNALAQESTAATPKAGGVRGKSAPWHRAGQQVTGWERCQCRKARIHRQHSGGAFLVWVRRKARAAPTGRTVYQRKQGLLDDSLLQQLRNPSLRMVLA